MNRDCAERFLQVVSRHEYESLQLLIGFRQRRIRLLETGGVAREAVNFGTEFDFQPLALDHALRPPQVGVQKAQFTIRRTMRAPKMRGECAQPFAAAFKQGCKLHARKTARGIERREFLNPGPPMHLPR